MPRVLNCYKSGCSDRPYVGGLCQKHQEEDLRRSQRRDTAVKLLQTCTIDGIARLENKEFHDELLRLRIWWHLARDVSTIRNFRSNKMPSGQAMYASEWCISLAQELINADCALREGKCVSSKLDGTRGWVWGRFKKLEAGPQGNGFPRKLQNAHR